MSNKSTHLFTQPKNDAGLSSVVFKDIKLNRKIFSIMSERKELTVNDISEALNISTPKAGELLSKLVEGKLIRETGKRSAGPGRKATLYTLRHDNCYFLGVEIKKYKINIGLMGFDKSIVKSKLEIPFLYQEAGESLKEIIFIINNFLDEIKIERSKIAGLGISVAGRINVRTGEILTIYHFSDAPVKATL